MAIKRYTANADTTITNAYKSNLVTRGTGSNMGGADVLEVFHIYGQAATGSSESSRILIKFPITKVSDDRDNSVIPASGNVDFYLRDVFGIGLWTTGEGEARHKANIVDTAFTEEYWTLYQRFVLEPLTTRRVDHPNNPKTKEEFTSAFEESDYSFKFSKYLCLKMLEIMYSGTAKQREKFINLLYFYAASNTDQSSYFIKISDEGT